ncbi:unnamed protein product [Rotaria magnacalcarata]|uniref:Uncharacterized protein n=1 Tax=Rotaria magnacalcarata TaxID=392030 RepID=A0A816GN36_9BILA|nr:unnamed protein product [Rotaria magnacalcarata]CAF1676173.1 unnamed protein product [Rotaria magnacalcarata]
MSKPKCHKSKEAFKINIDLTEMKSCLAQGFLFAFGVRLFNSFDKAITTGVEPMPNDDEPSRTEHNMQCEHTLG